MKNSKGDKKMLDFKKFWQGKNNTPEQPESDHGGDYAVRRSKQIYVAARILAVVGAVLLWIYVASTNTVTEERDFSLVPITYREENVLKSDYGLIVQSINIDTLNVKLMGNRTDVRALTASDVKAYVNLGGITRAGEYELDVYVDVPSGTTCVSQTVDKVAVSVDMPSTKTMPLSPEKVVISGWSLDKDCFFGEITLNTEQIILEGPTLELEKVADVEVRTDVIGSADASFTATASVHFLDSEGAEIVGSGVSVRGGNHLRVSVEVLKTVKVKLVLEGSDGVLSDDLVTLTPSHVLLTGEPDALAGRKELVVGKIDQAALKTDTERSFELSFEGIKVTNESGEEISSVDAVIRSTVFEPKTFTVTDIPVLQGDMVIGRVNMHLVGGSADDEEILKLCTAENITIIAPNASTVDINKLIVSFDRPYLGAVSEYSLYSYRGAI